MKKIFLLILAIPFLALAQGPGELKVDNKTVHYESSIETEVGTLYYVGDTLVASKDDTMTILYKNDTPTFEAHDTNGDGKADVFFTLDKNEKVLKITGESANSFKRPNVLELNQLLSKDSNTTETEDLVGSLDSITIPGGTNWTLWIILAILFGGTILWYFKIYKK